MRCGAGDLFSGLFDGPSVRSTGLLRGGWLSRPWLGPSSSPGAHTRDGALPTPGRGMRLTSIYLPRSSTRTGRPSAGPDGHCEAVTHLPMTARRPPGPHRAAASPPSRPFPASPSPARRPRVPDPATLSPARRPLPTHHRAAQAYRVPAGSWRRAARPRMQHMAGQYSFATPCCSEPVPSCSCRCCMLHTSSRRPPLHSPRAQAAARGAGSIRCCYTLASGRIAALRYSSFSARLPRRECAEPGLPRGLPARSPTQVCHQATCRRPPPGSGPGGSCSPGPARVTPSVTPPVTAACHAP